MRTVSHSQGLAKAGVVASWIALRKDADTPTQTDPNESLIKLEAAWVAAELTNNPDKIGRFLADGFLFVGAGGIHQTRAQQLDDFRTGCLVPAAARNAGLSAAINLQSWIISIHAEMEFHH